MRLSKRFHSVLFPVLLLVVISGVGSAQDYSSSHKVASDSKLLEVGQPTRPVAIPAVTDQLKVISYNIRWRGGDDLKKMIQLMQNDPEIGNAAILGLQEVDRKKERTGHANSARIMADQLGMYYAWAAPPSVKAGSEEETGVALLSIFPLTEVERIVLPHPGPGKRRRAAIGATIQIGDKRLRVYSVHSETRLAVAKKLEQMGAVLKDLARFPKDTPAIVLGDLNTWEGKAVDRTAKLFKEASFHTPFNEDSTFRRRIVLFDLKLKLDWIWLRGLQAKSHGIDRNIDLSDHWPLWVVVGWNKE